MLRTALCLVDDRVAADDIVQEALLRAWRHRSACTRPHAPMPWLLAIVRNEASRWRAQPRHLRERPERELDDAGGPLDEAVPVDGELLSAMAVRDALAELPESDRRLLGLRYADELSDQEIARVLGVPDATVKLRLRRLRRRLQGELSEGERAERPAERPAARARPPRRAREQRERGSGGPPGIGDVARRLRALGHPARVQIVLELGGEASSPAELLRRGGMDMSLEALCYHVRVLHQAGLLGLEETLARGGAVEHRYRLTPAGRSARDLVQAALDDQETDHDRLAVAADG